MARELMAEMWRGLGGDASRVDEIDLTGEGALPSAFAVTDLATAAVSVAAAAAAEVVLATCGRWPRVTVDRRLSSAWFGMSVQPLGWSLPSPWDPVAGDYRTSDGWIRLHTNAPAHRAAALRVLGVSADRDEVERAVALRGATELETAVVDAGGCAAEMRSLASWAAHPQGRAVSVEPLVRVEKRGGAAPVPARWRPTPSRPLAGLRVLDLTRVLAGPVATRFLAGLGADVLRIDPPAWDEGIVVPEVTLGKRCARLDLRAPEGRRRILSLLSEADVLVHGYRPGALDRLDLGGAVREECAPRVVEVTLDAYGWTGPWAERRGFDSLVQMSAGIAEEGMRLAGSAIPFPLPVQALDHATGYLLAAAALRGLAARAAGAAGVVSRASLARTAWLLAHAARGALTDRVTPTGEADLADATETTPWGPSRRLKPPATIEGCPLAWDRPAGPLGSAEAVWLPEVGA